MEPMVAVKRFSFPRRTNCSLRPAWWPNQTHQMKIFQRSYLTATAAMEERIVWLLFLDFQILERDLPSWTRELTVIIHLPSGFVLSDVESYHGCIEKKSRQRNSPRSSSFRNCTIHSWKSTKSSSLRIRAQGASVVYTDQETKKSMPLLQSLGHEET